MYTTTTNANQPAKIHFDLSELHQYWNHTKDSTLINCVLEFAIEYAMTVVDGTETRQSLSVLLDHLLRWQEETMPVKDSRTVLLCGVLANLYRAAGHYREAEMLSRHIVEETVTSVAALAADIKAQQDPSRNDELERTYRRALRAGMAQLESQASKVLGLEIAAVYAALAELLVDMGKIEAAESEISQLILLNNRQVAGRGFSWGTPYQMLAAYKSTLRIALLQFATRPVREVTESLQRAVALAQGVVKLTDHNDTVVSQIRDCWSETMQKLIDALKIQHKSGENRQRIIEDELLTVVKRYLEMVEYFPKEYFLRVSWCAVYVLLAVHYLACNLGVSAEQCLKNLLALYDVDRVADDPVMTETLLVAYKTALLLKPRQSGCFADDADYRAQQLATELARRLTRQQYYDQSIFETLVTGQNGLDQTSSR